MMALDAGRYVQQYTPSDAGAFYASSLIQDAICMRLQEMGANLSKIRQRFPEYYEAHHNESWHRLIGLRNLISHGYGDVDPEVIWQIVTRYLPELLAELEKLAS